MDARFMEDGEFRHSTQLPEAPRPGQYVKIHDKTFKVTWVTWVLTRPFPHQSAGVQADMVEVIGNDRSPSLRGREGQT